MPSACSKKRKVNTTNKFPHFFRKILIDCECEINWLMVEKEILETDKTDQLNSQKRPSGLHHYLKIDNTNLSAEEVAKQIQEKMKTIEKGHTHV